MGVHRGRPVDLPGLGARGLDLGPIWDVRVPRGTRAPLDAATGHRGPADAALADLPGLQSPAHRGPGAVCRAGVGVGEVLDAKYLVAFTEPGSSARRMARHRSPIPLLAFTPRPEVRSQLALCWGVETFL